MKVVMWPLTKIRPYKRNPRKIDAASVETVAKSIEEFGFRQPIVVDENGEVLVGHTRHRAAKYLELKKVPVHIAEGLSEAQKRAYRIADNKTGEASSWQDDLLNLELAALDDLDFDLSITGFSLDDLPDAFQVEDDPVDSVVAPDEAKVVFGGATAMHRASAPIRFWRENGYLEGNVLDFGAGNEDHEFAKYDAFTHPETEPLLSQWDTIMCNFVLQVQPAEHLIDQICALLRSLLVQNGKCLIAVRNDVAETTKTIRGTQIAKSRDEWAEVLGRFFWVEPVEVKAFHGFVCTPVPTGE